MNGNSGSDQFTFKVYQRNQDVNGYNVIQETVDGRTAPLGQRSVTTISFPIPYIF